MTLSRRSLLKHALLAGAWYGAVGRSFAQASSPEVLGQGDFKYRVVPGWGVLDEKTPVNDCHGLARTADGHIVLLTNHIANNVIFYDEAGKLARKWTGPKFLGAHGLSLARHRNKDTFFITDLNLHTVTRFALSGEQLGEWRLPANTGKYAKGDLFICDIGNNVIRKVDMKTKRISTIAGTGKSGVTPDGAPVKGTPLKGPRSIDFDAAGNLWVCTREGNQVFKLDLKNDKITHIAGTGKKGFTGNGGPAKLATLSGPKGVAVDAQGNAWLVDTESHSIRMVDARTGNLELMIGTGAKHDGPDGDPLKCGLARPHGIWVDKDGSVFVGDSENHRLRVLKK